MGEAALKQQNFNVDKDGRILEIRQERIPLEKGVCSLGIEGITLQVLDIHCFGCSAAVPPAEIEKSAKLLKTNIIYEGTLTFLLSRPQTLRLRFVRTETDEHQPPTEMRWAFEIVGHALNIDRVQAQKAAVRALLEQRTYIETLAVIPAEFKNFIYQMRDVLEKLKQQADQLEQHAPQESLHENHEYRHTLVENFADYLAQVVPPLYPSIPPLMQGMNDEQIAAAVAFARGQLGPLLWSAPFTHRAFFKPRGYAGDFEMMNHFYRDEMIGKTLYDQCIHKFFVNEPPGAAVKNRGQYLHRKLTELFERTPAATPLKILSLASGPAMEQQVFLRTAPQFHGRPVEFTCLDQDGGSLQHAQCQLLTAERELHSGYQFKFTHMAIRNVISQGCPEGGYDLIYSAGLFDYLNEFVARNAAQKMLEAVKDGGQVIIGNFSKNNPWVAFAELTLDWRLIYRSEQDLLKIFNGLGKKLWVEKETLGINLFIVIEK